MPIAISLLEAVRIAIKPRVARSDEFVVVKNNRKKNTSVATKTVLNSRTENYAAC